MKVLELYRDYNVPHQTEGHKHCRDGWVNTACPFCTGNPGLHLGATLDGKIFSCWRCGWKPASKAIAKLIGVSEPQAKKIIREYGGTSRRVPQQVKRAPRAKSHKLPTGTGTMNRAHRRYLASRGFDPNQLERNWKLLGTGPVSSLDEVDYSHRILAPIYWDGKRVSFQTRDITGRHPAKYMGCPEDRELISHKQILYGKQHHWKERGIVVEGITDVWRLGPLAFATLGIKYTRGQLRRISQNFESVVILFDDDPQALEQARLLQKELLFRGMKADLETLDGDPADLDEAQAKNLIRRIY